MNGGGEIQQMYYDQLKNRIQDNDKAALKNCGFIAKYDGGCRTATEKYPAKPYSNKEASLKACENQCAKTAHCKYFEYDGTWCHLHRNTITGGNNYPDVLCYVLACFVD